MRLVVKALNIIVSARCSGAPKPKVTLSEPHILLVAFLASRGLKRIQNFALCGHLDKSTVRGPESSLCRRRRLKNDPAKPPVVPWPSCAVNQAAVEGPGSLIDHAGAKLESICFL